MSDENQALVLSRTEDRVRVLTLNTPPHNILSAAMMHALTAEIETLLSDTSLVAVLINAKGKSFSAGADVGEHAPEQAATMIAAFEKMFLSFQAMPLPVVMAVEGGALGAGFELVMMADFLVATETATFGLPEIRLGFFPPLGVAWLSRLVGPTRAMEVTCSGRIYNAQDMQRMGLVRQVVAPADLDNTIESILRDFRKASGPVMRLCAGAVKATMSQPFDTALQQADQSFLKDLMALEDVREGIASFYEKRKPNWSNR